MNNQVSNRSTNKVSNETKQKEENSKEKEEYYRYLEKHNFTEMNFPYSSFLRKNKTLVGFEEGAI